MLGTLGFRLVPANKPPRSMIEFLSHAKALGFHPSLIVDIGIADGTPEIYKAYPKSRYILIEPLVEFEPVLRQLCQRLDAEYILAGADESVGEIEIHVHDDLAGSSLLGEVEGSLADGVKRKVPTICLDDVLAKRTESPILLKIDVQGAELRVLRGARESLHKIDMIIMEVALISSMEDGPDFFDVMEFMKQVNFYLYDIVGGNIRPIDGSLKQVDLVFVQKDNPWRKERRYATVEQRQRLNERGRKRRRDFATRLTEIGPEPCTIPQHYS
ncbi:MAG: FkbM family methyltransferase [Gammaproteobacteria bacterium]|nr:FkbM family methyltransferase [Gammaproteobacteria bacterium]